jgi:flagellar biosynthetic protein FlhB
VSDQAQRTEQPPPRRLEKARKEGRFPVSKHFVGAFQLALFVALLAGFADRWLELGQSAMRHLLREAFSSHFGPATLVALVRQELVPAALPLVAAGGLLALSTFAIHLLSTQLGFAAGKLAPDLTRLNPASRLKGMLGRNSVQMLQAVAVLVVFTAVLYAMVQENFASYLQLPLLSVVGGLNRVAGSVETLLWRAVLLFAVLGIIDLFREKRRHNRELRMTKQEVREEHKESEGDPQIKMRIRRLQRDLLRRKMMSEVPKATAVVVNPTHYAVAIRYDVDSMAAPRVVAKGKNYLALRIRQKAIDHGVPIVENPPLARALYSSADVGQEIPAHLYRAVAEILAYIYRLMGGRFA